MTAFIVPPEVGWDTEGGQPEQPRLGRIERTCDSCGRDWGPTRCSDPQCNSDMFTDRVVQPIPFHTRVMERLRPKPKAPLATAAQTSALRGFRASVEQFSAELTHMDEMLRSAVRDDDVEELQAAQGLVHAALSITGDASRDRIPGLSLSLRAFHDALNDVIQRLEATTPK
jgi:hypothetical protein